ncbi:tyrosine-type recombinase/integrase [Candidatus Lucifugimonas marina]|uniref:Tyrosine-type recombinase/integrase n=1 Tax=Candidatus Lucifugimonas marina TaxID=3038979 RepID=A0AAJ5ZIQ9_9CHLR|nr:tyrosine-type recombinase/integrase [SAR202 cluster bacterium JH702]MDG0868288.1 tyrosine-type recombinase/integrase [SAR202 cluster bacterium JH639]WFG34932.1 tyrosine-type recombinase/integrase [SAR202 cluster bacterium JH545]WFG38883.1 tyrosine-type recombinase/integrase [SAR202 cluster bacterium JH1073]
MNASGQTLQDAFDVFTLFRQAEGLSPKTINWYRYIMRTLMLSPVGVPGRAKMSKLSNEELYRHVASLSFGGHGGKSLKASSINGHVRGLRAFFNWAYQENYTEERLLENLKPPKPDYKEITVLNDAEITRLLIVLKNEPRNLAILTTMLDTGLRITETAEATLDGLDLSSGHLKVMGKGRKERIVLVGMHTRRHIVRYLRSVADTRRSNNNRIFIAEDGGPLTKNALALVFARLKIRSKIPRLHAHLLRHTFATRYLLAGGNALALKQLLGHSSLKMVDNYIHLAAADAARSSGGLSILDRIHSGEPVENHLAPAVSQAGFVNWTSRSTYEDGYA